jgi:hypothetical protein
MKEVRVEFKGAGPQQIRLHNSTTKPHINLHSCNGLFSFLTTSLEPSMGLSPHNSMQPLSGKGTKAMLCFS